MKNTGLRASFENCWESDTYTLFPCIEVIFLENPVLDRNYSPPAQKTAHFPNFL